MSDRVVMAEAVRDELPGLRVVVHCGEGKFKSQLKRADATGARLALILGEDELGRDAVSVKHLRDAGGQVTVSNSELNRYLTKVFPKE